MLLHESVAHMSLHPISVAICFIIFGLFCLKVMLNMFKQGKKGLGGFMLISTIVFFFSAFLSAQISGT